MRYLLIALLLFIGCDEDPVSIEESETIYGTWQLNYTGYGYYFIENDTPGCQPVSFNYSGFTDYYNDDSIYDNSTGYCNIKISEDTFSIHNYIELTDILENDCDADNLMIGAPLSFSNNICFSELEYSVPIISYNSNSFILTEDGDDNYIFYYHMQNDELSIFNIIELNDPIGTITGFDVGYRCYFNSYESDEITDEIQCLELGGIWSNPCSKSYYVKINDSDF